MSTAPNPAPLDLWDRVCSRFFHDRALRAQQVLRIIRPRMRFIVGELLGGAAIYRIGDYQILLRNRSRDIDIVNEIWGPAHSYEPPPSLEPRLSRAGLRVIDLGGNIGLFALFAFQRWNVGSLTSFEPDTINSRLMRKTRDLNSSVQRRWSLRETAVSNYEGELALVSLGSPESHRADVAGQGILVPVEDIFSDDGSIDLLKIDIEGGEWPILADPRLRSLQADVIVIEWHWRGCKSSDPQRAVTEALDEAGYQIDRETPGFVSGIGTIWASRRRDT